MRTQALGIIGCSQFVRKQRFAATSIFCGEEINVIMPRLILLLFVLSAPSQVSSLLAAEGDANLAFYLSLSQIPIDWALVDRLKRTMLNSTDQIWANHSFRPIRTGGPRTIVKYVHSRPSLTTLI